ncbi:MAG: hypothetical protein AB1810_12910 [Pseudomonadota bacterium]
MLKKLRILFLLVVLLAVAWAAFQRQERLADWGQTKWVVVYPIAADDSPRTRDYIAQLSDADFATIEEYMQQEAQRYALAQDTPVQVRRGPQLDELPPQIEKGAPTLEVMLWSLKLRYWNWRMSRQHQQPPADIRIYVQYYDGHLQRVLDHSVGLSQLAVGVVKAFAEPKMTGANNVVIVHELLHIFGATDKYDPATNAPVYPAGFIAPEQQPLYPQPQAEIMAGRIPVAPDQLREPRRLEEVAIGPLTAQEIGWVGEK